MAPNQGFGSVVHLAGRFLSSLSPVGPSKEAEAWAKGYLSASEAGLFDSMSAPDRRHAIDVARTAIDLAEREPPAAGERTVARGFVAAALLHDVGKTEARLGTFGRVVATVLALVLGRSRVVAWSGLPQEARDGATATQSNRRPEPAGGGLKEQMGRYLAHDRLGAGLLSSAGSEAITIDWAREHHLPESRWTVEPSLGRVLKTADGD